MDGSRPQGTAERYTGPSALRIANLLPHRVSFERGWFWTSTAVCHGGKSDGLAFRQRPDGNGIDVRCHTGGCSAGVVITELEVLIGLPIWTAFEPVVEAADKAPEQKPWWKRKKVVVAGVVALVVAAPLLTLDMELFFLNLVGLGIGWLCCSGGSYGVRCGGSGADEVGFGPLTTHPNTQGPSPIRGRPFFFARRRARIDGNTKQWHSGGAR